MAQRPDSTDRNERPGGFTPMPGRQGMGAGNRTIEKAGDPRGALRRLVAYMSPYRWQMIGALIMVVLGSLSSLLGPYLVGVAINSFISAKNLAGLTRIALLMLASYLASWGFSYGQNYLMVSVSERALRTLRRELFEHLQSMSLGFFDARPQGELMSRLTNDIDAIDRALSQSVLPLIATTLQVSGIMVAMLVLNLWLALGAIAIMPLMLWFTARIGQGTRRGFRELQATLGQMNALMEEDITGAHVVQAFNRQERAIADFQHINNVLNDVSIRAQSLAMLLPPVLMVMGNMDIAIVTGLGGYLALRGLATVGTVATFIMYSRTFFRPLMSLGDVYNSIQSALAGAERVFHTLDEVPALTDVSDAIELAHVRGEVEFDHVDFEYVPGVPVLHGITLKAHPGQTIALVGPTGAGKTTIVNLLSRFYDVSGGAIRIDGHDIRNLQQHSLRRQLGVVLQDTFLFTNTVLENIRYGRLDATDEECITAARLANADQFIRRLPEGYQTQLSERANNLSQGQRQLLAITRAILSDPRILVLDEATSSVDTRTEIEIQEALLKLMKGRTSFVIAHRLSTIRNADLVLVVNGGRIIERGTHESLLAQRGFYYRLYMSQFRRGEWQAEGQLIGEAAR